MQFKTEERIRELKGPKEPPNMCPSRTSRKCDRAVTRVE